MHVFTMHWWDGPRRRTSDGVRYTAVTPRLPLYVGERRSILQALAFSLGCLRLLGHRFDAIEADQMPCLPLFPLRLVATLKRVPLTVTWHEVWGDQYWRQYLGRAGAVGAVLERWAMRLPDLVVAENDETRDRLVECGVAPEILRVLPNGVDLDQIAAAPAAAATFDLIYVGRLIEHKRVVDLLDAIGLLADAGTTLSCAVVGVGPERERLEHRAHELGISDRVTFFGTLEHRSAVYGLIKSSRALVLPSVREGFGLVVVEAFACGVPVITTDHPDNQARLLVDDGVTGWLTRPTSEALAATIGRALAHSVDMTGTGDTVDRFDWDRIAVRLGDLYSSLGQVAGRQAA